MHEILKFILEWNSVRFRQFLCPSSGVFHCTHSNGIYHTGYADCLWAGSGCFMQDQDVSSWSCSKAVYKPVWYVPLLCVQ